MAKQLIVWGLSAFWVGFGDQCRVLVAAHSMREAAEMVGIPLRYFREYASITGNKVELSVATEKGVWVAPLHQSSVCAEKYTRVEPKKAKTKD